MNHSKWLTFGLMLAYVSKLQVSMQLIVYVAVKKEYKYSTVLNFQWPPVVSGVWNFITESLIEISALTYLYHHLNDLSLFN